MDPSPFAERVLTVVEAVPAGWVFTYGDVSEWLGESSARAVGVILATYGSDVPWWRIVRADGRPAAIGDPSARERLRAEGVPFTDEHRVDLTRARWDPRV